MNTGLISAQVPFPSSPEDERLVLGLALAYPKSVLPKLLSSLPLNDFYDETCRGVYSLLRSAHDAGTPIEIVALAPSVLAKGINPGEFADLVVGIPAPDSFDFYRDRLKKLSARRKIAFATSDAFNAALVASLDTNPLLLIDSLRTSLEKCEVGYDGVRQNSERITASSLQTCLLTSDELEVLFVERRARLLGDWLCAGDLGYIFAPRGVGKTWLAMAVPQAISSSHSLGLWTAGELHAKVLYVDGEMPLELTKARNHGLSKSAHGVTYLHHDRVFELLEGSLNIALPKHQVAITGLLLEGGFDCLVLDNLSCLASGMDENKGMDHEAISIWLLELRRRKITVIFIHHAGRSGEMRGHSKREDSCSWIIQLTDAKSEGEKGAKFVSHFAKPSRNTSQALPDYLWHFQTNEQGITEITCEPADLSDYEQFIQHVRDGVECSKDISELMGKPKGTISKWAKRAEVAGTIKRKGNCLKPNGI